MTPESRPQDPPVDAALARSFGLTDAEYEHLCARLGRVPNYAELGVTSVMWSEHCSYKSSRVHLGRLPTTGRQVVQGPGENAGAVDIGDGYCAVFKMESHNHPSFIEPYQGAATGVGGILRDVFTMGARPVASLNSLRFGDPGHPKTPQLLRGVVAGVGGYGNCIGVPTVGGEVRFDPCFNGNNLVNAFTVGVAKSDELFFGTASGVGNPVLYVGSRTGRDGIHGATMASASFEDESEAKLPTVQVGDPFMEKLLLEACLEIFATDCLEGVQDMGAAGLTSSSVEMAARAETGIELDLDLIPRRARGLSPYELLLSESQERMLMVAKAGREQEVIEICERWDLDVAVVGRVTDTGRFVCRATQAFDPFVDAQAPRDAQVVVDLPLDLLADEAPKYDRPRTAPVAHLDSKRPVDFSGVSLASVREELEAWPGLPNLASRRAVYEQYDHIVGVGTVLGPGESDAAVVRVFPDRSETSAKYLALSADCNERMVKLSPRQGAAMAVAECCRNIVCSGGRPLGLTDCLNFGNPEDPEVMWQFSEAVDGMAAACRALDTPVVSGNVSLYNETDGRSIHPTPTVAVVGQLENLDARLSIAVPEEIKGIWLLTAPVVPSLEGSEWLWRREGRLHESRSLHFDLETEVALQRTLRALNGSGVIKAAHDLSEGGLWQGLIEMALASDTGLDIKLALPEEPEALVRALFNEAPSRVLLSFAASEEHTVRAAADSAGLVLAQVATRRADGRVVLNTQHGQFVRFGLDALRKRSEATLAELFKR